MNEGTRKQAQGTAQEHRLIAALQPQSAPVDERDFGDLMTIFRQFSRLLQYYNPDNIPLGTWEPFFAKDASFFLAEILMEDVQSWDDAIQKIIREIFALYLPIKVSEQEKRRWLKPKIALVAQLAEKVTDLAYVLNHWYVRALEINSLREQSPVATVMEETIRARLRIRFQVLEKWLDLLQREHQITLPPKHEKKKKRFHAIWTASEETDIEGLPVPEGNINELLNFAVEDFRKSGEVFLQSMRYILSEASGWLEDSLLNRNDHQPDIGLMMAFIKVFGYAQDHLNGLTMRHLDHYYRDILQFEKKTPPLDWTFVSFKLADQLSEHFLPENTLLLAGVNPQGVPSHYRTKTPLLVTPASIAALKTLYVSKYHMANVDSSYRLISGIFAAPVANSKDGLGQPFFHENPHWPIFGEEQMDKSTSERGMLYAEVGWAVASPVLALSQGYRTIDLGLYFTEASYGLLSELVQDMSHNRETDIESVVHRLFASALRFWVSVEDGWLEVKNAALKKESNQWADPSIHFTMALSLDDPAVVENSPAVTGAPYHTHLPTLKIELVSDEATYIYSFLKDLVLEEVTITTEVKGLKTLQLINEAGPLDNTAPFFPFGPLPTRNSYLLIGSAEMFKKRLQDIKINIEWNNLPDHENGFQGYFADYGDRVPADNNSYTVQVSALSNHHFKPVQQGDQEVLPLFSAPAPDGPLDAATTFDHLDLERLAIRPDYHLQELGAYSNTLASGYFKLKLNGPPGMFGHKAYPQLFAEVMLANARLTKEPPRPIPPEPFVPIVQQISVDYRASSTLNFKDLEFRKNDSKTDERFYHLEPFGTAAIFKNGKARQNSLVPRFDYNGYLFVGLKDFRPPQALQLFFAIEESKRRFSSTEIENEIEWSVLAHDRWIRLDQDQVLSDGTYQFTTSGIISLDLPMGMSDDNTRMEAGLHWLRVGARGDLGIVGRVREIIPHTALVSWVDNGDSTHFLPSVTLPPIKELVTTTPAIAELRQLIPFQGREKLSSHLAFYVRASERLRHKNRAVQIWDIERLVLEHFSDIQQVKCIGVFGNEQHYHLTPGTVKVVVVPRPHENEHELTPKVGFRMLRQIQEFLEVRASPFAKIQVINPQYEFVKLNCSILLPPELYIARGKYLRQLEEDLKYFICPWLRGGTVTFGGQIIKNEILSFLKSRPYVKFVSRFSLVQIFEQVFANEKNLYDLTDTALTEKPEHLIEGTTPWSVLVPVTEHAIQFLKNENYLVPEITALEGMQLGTDFIVVKDKEDENVKQHARSPAVMNEEEDWMLTN